MDIQSICRTCMGLGGPFLSIYLGAGNTNGCIADKLRNCTKIKPKCGDQLPEKVCLTCIGEINRCYTFILKCDDSNRTLRQLIPTALPEEVDDVPQKLESAEKAVQTTAVECFDAAQQTQDVVKAPMVITQESDSEVPVATQPQKLSGKRTRKRKTVPVNVDAPAPRKKHRMDTQKLNVELDDGSKIILEFESNDETSNAKDVSIKEDEEGKDSYYELSEYKISVGKSDQDVTYEFLDNDDQEPTKDDLLTESGTKTAKAAEMKRKPLANVHNLRSHSTISQDKAPQTSEEHQEEEEDDQQDEQEEKEELAENEADGSVDTLLEIQLPEGTEFMEDQVEGKSLLSGTATVDPVVDDSDGGNGQLYRCDLCNAGFVKQNSLRHHRKLNACTVVSYICNKCQRIFISEEALRDHNKAQCQELWCSICRVALASKLKLADHMINEHKRKEQYKCKECHKVFTMKSALKDHMRVHSGEKPFVCPFCNKAFSQNANLRQHVSRHSEDKKFKCEQCTCSFVTKAELKSHVSTHNNERRYKCDQCPAAYTTSSSLCKHKRKHTGERPYACEYCPMRFTTLNILKNHRRTHTGEKPFKCRFCTKAFAQRGDCLIHEAIHTGEKKFVCGDCDAQFSRLTLARTHLKTSANCKEILRKSDGKEKVQHFTVTSMEEVLEDDMELC